MSGEDFSMAADSDESLARAALEAAAPILAAQVRREVAEQIAKIQADRRCGARFCDNCECRAEDAALARQMGEAP